MEEFLNNIPEILRVISVLLSGLVVVATAVAQLTSSSKDDIAVGKFKKFVEKLISFLPTIGKNPQTKKLEEKLKEVI